MKRMSLFLIPLIGRYLSQLFIPGSAGPLLLQPEGLMFLDGGVECSFYLKDFLLNFSGGSLETALPIFSPFLS